MKKLLFLIVALIAAFPTFGQSNQTKKVAILETVNKEDTVSYDERMRILSGMVANINNTTEYEEPYETVENNPSTHDGEAAADAADVEGTTDNIIDTKTIQEDVMVEPIPPVDDNNKIFYTVEQKPQFPGGDVALMKWVADHLRYPINAYKNGIQGRVTVQFVVTKTGAVGHVKILRGKDPELDKEAIRVVKSLPKFIPGMMNGHPVNVYDALPIIFRLNEVQ